MDRCSGQHKQPGFRRPRRQATQDPKLASLERRLELGAIDREFFRDYFCCAAPYARRSIVLRLALDDARVRQRTHKAPISLTPTLLKKIIDFLHEHPGRPLEPFETRFSREGVPSHLATLFCGRRVNGMTFLRRAIIQPYFSAISGETPFPEISSTVTLQEARQILGPVAKLAWLAPEDTERFLAARFRSPAAEFFFDTGAPLLDARNILQFCAVLFGKSGHGGRLQAKIPRALSERIGILRLSIPELMLATDLLSLAVLGLLREPQDSLSGKVARLIRALTPPPPGLEDLTSLARHHFQRTLLNAVSSAALLQKSSSGCRENVFWTGLLFNVERLVYDGAADGRFIAFGPLYHCIDHDRLREEILRHFKREDFAFGEALNQLMGLEPEQFRGIKGRSLANTLFHAKQVEGSGEEPGVRLPPVALWRLGVPEPIYTGRYAGKYKTQPRGHSPTRRYAVNLPLLERLSRKVPILDA